MLDGRHQVMSMSDQEEVSELRQKVLSMVAAAASALAPFSAAHAGILPEGNEITPYFLFLCVIGLAIGFGPWVLLGAELLKQAETGKFNL